MPSSPITTEETAPLDLHTVAGVEAELENTEADYETGRKILLEAWQKRRKHLRALLEVLKDQAADSRGELAGLLNVLTQEAEEDKEPDSPDG